MKKNIKTAVAVLSPKNISAANFATDVAEYKEVLDNLAELKGEREGVFRKMKVFMRRYLADKPVEGTELSTLVSKIQVFKDTEQITYSSLAKKLSRLAGYHFDAISTNSQAIRELRKAFGDKVADTILEVGEVYKARNDQDKELDEEATEYARDEFEKLTSRYDDLEAQIKTNEIKASHVKEYVSLYKDLASIASISTESKKRS